MVKKIVFFAMGLVILPQFCWAAQCSRINLTKCLDSACAINLSSNPAARCQYCGTADAGEPAASNMKSISAGASSKNSISAKELKKAPSDPGERYVWATKLCLEKIQNCDEEDVSEAYDPLIEKSCTAAGISNDMASLQKKAAKNKKTATTCTNEISLCVTTEAKCDSDYSKCSDDAKFDEFFASCSSQATGCTTFIPTVRDSIATIRKSNLTGAKANLAAIVKEYKTSRLQRLSTINSSCLNNTDYDKCVATVCSNNTTNNCGTQATQTIANNLCQFYKTACSKIEVITEKEMQKRIDELQREFDKESSL